MSLDGLPEAHVREWSGLSGAIIAARWEDVSRGVSEGDDMPAERMPEYARFAALVIVHSLCGPDGVLAYAPEDADEVAATFSMDEMQAIVDAASDLNGMTKRAAEAIEAKP